MTTKIDPSFLYEMDGNTSNKADYYIRQGSYVTESMLTDFYTAIMERSYLASGAGGYINQTQAALSRFDRLGTFLIPINIEHMGLVFITRPRLNLSDVNIRQDRILMSLDTNKSSYGHNVQSISFATRCLLDSQFVSDNLTDALRSPIFDPYNPFLVPICNCLQSVSGLNDAVLDTETTPAGFHGEDYTYAKGSDMLNRSGELSVAVKEMQGGVNMALLYLWKRYVALQNFGYVRAYEDDIYEQRLNYTVSIYRFTLDPSHRYISGWSKATGCFPKNVPLGARFNYDRNEQVISAAQQFSFQMAYNKVEYMDFAILHDFNRLMRRYVAGIDSGGMYKVASNSAEYNGIGYPYIVSSDRGKLEIEYRAFPEEIETLKGRDTVATTAASVKTSQAQEMKKVDEWLEDNEDVWLADGLTELTNATGNTSAWDSDGSEDIEVVSSDDLSVTTASA